MSRQFVYPFTVSSFDADAFGDMRPTALVRRLQVAADAHARQHQLAVDQLLATGRTWVLREFHLRVLRTPRFMEPCRVTTWATSRSAGIRAWRDFVLESEASERLAEATSLWLMLDAEKWKLIRLPSAVFMMVNPEPEPALESLEIGGDFAPAQVPEEIRVHWLDVDLNGHVNNVRYLEWMLGALPDAHWKQYSLAHLAVDFQDEARPGDGLFASALEAADGQQQLRISNSDGKLLIRATTGWKLRDGGDAA